MYFNCKYLPKNTLKLPVINHRYMNISECPLHGFFSKRSKDRYFMSKEDFVLKYPSSQSLDAAYAPESELYYRNLANVKTYANKLLAVVMQFLSFEDILHIGHNTARNVNSSHWSQYAKYDKLDIYENFSEESFYSYIKTLENILKSEHLHLFSNDLCKIQIVEKKALNLSTYIWVFTEDGKRFFQYSK